MNLEVSCADEDSGGENYDKLSEDTGTDLDNSCLSRASLTSGGLCLEEDDEEQCCVSGWLQLISVFLGKSDLSKKHATKNDDLFRTTLVALKGGQIKAKVNDSHDFIFIKIRHSRVFMQSELSAPQFILRTSDILFKSECGQSKALIIYLRERTDKQQIVTIVFTFENILEMEVFSGWILHKMFKNSKKQRAEKVKKPFVTFPTPATKNSS